MLGVIFKKPMAGGYCEGCSTFVVISSGVPQGSHLGPLLFNVFTIDIHKIITNSNFLLFVDDKKIIKLPKSISDCQK